MSSTSVCKECGTCVLIPPDAIDAKQIIEKHRENECTKRRFKCSFTKCQFSHRYGHPITSRCPKCNLVYCLKHRYPESHDCNGITVEQAVKAERIARLDSTIARLTTTYKKPNAINDQTMYMAKSEMQKKIDIMKLRQKSIGELSIPASDRVYTFFETNKTNVVIYVNKGKNIYLDRGKTVGWNFDRIRMLFRFGPILKDIMTNAAAEYNDSSGPEAASVKSGWVNENYKSGESNNKHENPIDGLEKDLKIVLQRFVYDKTSWESLPFQNLTKDCVFDGDIIRPFWS